MAIAYDLNSLR